MCSRGGAVAVSRTAGQRRRFKPRALPACPSCWLFPPACNLTGLHLRVTVPFCRQWHWEEQLQSDRRNAAARRNDGGAERRPAAPQPQFFSRLPGSCMLVMLHGRSAKCMCWRAMNPLLIHSLTRLHAPWKAPDCLSSPPVTARTLEGPQAPQSSPQAPHQPPPAPTQPPPSPHLTMVDEPQGPVGEEVVPGAQALAPALWSELLPPAPLPAERCPPTGPPAAAARRRCGSSALARASRALLPCYLIEGFPPALSLQLHPPAVQCGPGVSCWLCCWSPRPWLPCRAALSACRAAHPIPRSCSSWAADSWPPSCCAQPQP